MVKKGVSLKSNSFEEPAVKAEETNEFDEPPEELFDGLESISGE